MRVWLKIGAMAVAFAGLAAVGGVYGASYYYTTQHGQGCASCHEMAALVGAVHGSAHRNAGCMDCHEASLGTKLRHIRVHLGGKLPETIRLRDVDVLAMTANCKKCHQKEYAGWHSGPHSATYSQIFTDSIHNSKRRLMDDCLRCHGMHFGGPVRELVAPLDTKGPWKVMRPGLGDEPTMPCQACHQVHRQGSPESKPASRPSVTGGAVDDSLAFFDRRERAHFAAATLPIPSLHDGARPIRMNQDPRQRLCYQCHASRVPETGTEAARSDWGPPVGSGDDRTPMGVHEGLSCLSCHFGHNESAAASCKTCHPQMSNCGLDVEKMDTSFASAQSKHDIHWVKCEDCHQHGVPKVKAPAGARPHRGAQGE